MTFQDVIKPLLPDNCYISTQCDIDFIKIVRRGRGKKRKVIGYGNQTSAGITLSIYDPVVKKHVQTMILITDSPVLL